MIVFSFAPLSLVLCSLILALGPVLVVYALTSLLCSCLFNRLVTIHWGRGTVGFCFPLVCPFCHHFSSLLSLLSCHLSVIHFHLSIICNQSPRCCSFPVFICLNTGFLSMFLTGSLHGFVQLSCCSRAPESSHVFVYSLPPQLSG